MDGEAQFAALSVLRGIRNGLFYGTKIRMPHALVMTLLFRPGSPTKMADGIAKLTWEHSRNLALFAGSYKALLALVRLVRLKLGDKLKTPPGVPASQLDAFLAAAFVSRFVWARHSSVNHQIVLYLVGRVASSLMTVTSEWCAKREAQFPGSNGVAVSTLAKLDFPTVFPWVATVTWGTVLWLYEYHPLTLQSSLFGSMDFLYHETNAWTNGVSDFMPSPATAAVFVYLTLRAAQNGKGK